MECEEFEECWGLGGGARTSHRDRHRDLVGISELLATCRDSPSFHFGDESVSVRALSGFGVCSPGENVEEGSDPYQSSWGVVELTAAVVSPWRMSFKH